jgi:hypothetical protein
MFGRMRVAVALAIGSVAAAAVGCGHAGPDTCGGYSVERQWDKRFRLTVTAKVTEPPQWKLDRDGNPSPASFGGDGIEEARALYGRVAHQRCLDLGFQESSGGAGLEWRAEKSVTSVSTCAEPGAPARRFYAIRIWGDHIRCEYVEDL